MEPMYQSYIVVNIDNIDIKNYLKALIGYSGVQYRIPQLMLVDCWGHIELMHMAKNILISILETHCILLRTFLQVCGCSWEGNIHYSSYSNNAFENDLVPGIKDNDMNDTPIISTQRNHGVKFPEKFSQPTPTDLNSHDLNIIEGRILGNKFIKEFHSLNNDINRKTLYSQGWLPLYRLSKVGSMKRMTYFYKLVKELNQNVEISILENGDILRLTCSDPLVLSEIGQVLYELIENGRISEISEDHVSIFIDEFGLENCWRRNKQSIPYDQLNYHDFLDLLSEGRKLKRSVICGLSSDLPPIAGWKSMSRWKRWGRESEIIVRSIKNLKNCGDVLIETMFLQIHRTLNNLDDSSSKCKPIDEISAGHSETILNDQELSFKTDKSACCQNITVFLGDSSINEGVIRHLVEIMARCVRQNVHLTIWIWSEQELSLDLRNRLSEAQIFDIHSLANLTQLFGGTT